MDSVTRDSKVYTLSSERGKVSYLLKSDSGMVRKVMSAQSAMRIMEEGSLSESSEQTSHPIAVNEKYFFPGTVTEEGK